jgi:hypothetical protein
MHLNKVSRAALAGLFTAVSCSSSVEPASLTRYSIHLHQDHEDTIEVPACVHANDPYCHGSVEAAADLSGSLVLDTLTRITIDSIDYHARIGDSGPLRGNELLDSDSAVVSLIPIHQVELWCLTATIRVRKLGNLLQGTWSQARNCHSFYRSGTFVAELTAGE